MTEEKLKYEKPPKTIEEQISILRERGLVIQDEEMVKYYLTNISYYHLSIYFKFFQEKNKFHKNTQFEDILKLYIFDNKLRFLLLELLERIEKSFKCRMIYTVSVEENNSHFYLDEEIFINQNTYQNAMTIIKDEVRKSKEISILHYKNKYNEPELPPIWAIVEILSFGQCVKICKWFKRVYKNKIARTLDEDEKFIMSWMHCLSNLRNNCAHHSRLWNRNFIFMPRKHNKYKKYLHRESHRSLFNYLVILQIMLSKINPSSSWLERLKGYIEEYNIEIQHMGFPNDWEERLNKITLNN